MPRSETSNRTGRPFPSGRPLPPAAFIVVQTRLPSQSEFSARPVSATKQPSRHVAMSCLIRSPWAAPRPRPRQLCERVTDGVRRQNLEWTCLRALAARSIWNITSRMVLPSFDALVRQTRISPGSTFDLEPDRRLRGGVAQRRDCRRSIGLSHELHMGVGSPVALLLR